MEDHPNNIRLYGVIADTPEFNQIWDLAKPYIEKAIFYSDGKYSIDSVLSSLLARDMQLWGAFDDKGLCVACVTSIVKFPLKRVFFLLFIGGRDSVNWLHLIERLKCFAKEHQCDHMEGYGRPGWEKLSKPLGFKKVHTIFKFNLN